MLAPKSQRLLESCERHGVSFSEADWQDHGAPCLLSDYLLQQLERHPKWLAAVTSKRQDWQPSLSHFYGGEQHWLAPESDPDNSTMSAVSSIADMPEWDEATFMRQLRWYRHYWMVRLIYADINQAIELETLTRCLSLLADTVVNASVIWSQRQYQNLYGQALDAQGKPQSLIVIGMGKLGGYELNLSSDIDLIFAFREHGETQGGKKSTSHQEYFTKIGQKLIQHLDQVTADGFVFRVDMRLRPFGQSGALVLNMDSLENYYQDQGRDWERYAMIKARVMAGSEQDKKEFEAIRRPFVYRKYLDFGAISALRDLKGMIAKEVRRKGIEHNIKLGEGGIREVEFIVQALQILHGGRNQGLQNQALFQVLPLLAEHDYLPQQEVDLLLDAYRYLRRVEHALQGARDEQTQLLPSDPVERELLALRMGENSWQALDQRLWDYRHQVHGFFKSLIDDPEETSCDESAQEAWRVMLKQPDEEHLAEVLATIPWHAVDDTINRVYSFVSSKAVVFMQPIGQERLATFMAAFVKALEDEQHPDVVVERILPILEAVLRRTSYLVLLCENQSAITHLIRLCRESVWFSEAISTTPALLDELLDAHALFSPPSKQDLQIELDQILNRLPEEDEEAHMDALRRFRRSIILRIAACDITGILPVMKVSDHLTWLAEVILERVLQQAWHYLTQKHGYPIRDGEPRLTPELIIVGYGKSGGWELGYDSDLDLVFLHDADGKGATNGQRSVDNLTFYTRLGQRLIHALTSFTAAGRLYEVDMRLRPSGNSGMLVASFAGFEEYQKNEAWVWEHQALCRARALAGDSDLMSRFEDSRKAILGQVRDRIELKQSVIEMREKMRAHLDSGGKDKGFDLKQGAGGIIDIEFMVQYLVLARSHEFPQLMRYSDNVRQIEAAAEVGLLDLDTAEYMRETYKEYRALVHRLNLQKLGRVVAEDTLSQHQQRISQYWEYFLQNADI
ncbi:bifunctional [glutamate--ammonia ligase]-adenylyl-L-tyrosine phosphorylase/[glutamate--ammonia-ligase] adenylyltransferase [Maribrevibacterium harenarium]|uniref:Bifunctional glutamine synthetase adenylyltransferase/adenylyl-removing enzyme n=1 Tax=Maribrevibacterium harenarium TaxID=2589817 RepID=A0A501WR80_9GAMM|nr:bifunctional [glutamate--ammonia ligase]-adenylyl-L-tyrosine phosphorylase/[glutamate--ammonia-ligase] adenylyltransferase [Maribrevibacterium harenarium]